MTIEEEVFQKSKIDKSKLITYGFQKIDENYQYSKNILDNSFRIDITIFENGNVKGKVFDYSFQEEYTNFRISHMTGGFSEKIKSIFTDLLNDIRKNCTFSVPFLSDQSNRITKLIKEKYNDNPIFEWKKFPRYALFKNSTTNKWYGVIMDLDKSKLDSNSSGEVQIIDIKLDKNKVQDLLDREGFFPAYHMNKKNWITILLDDTVSDNEVMELIEESYFYSSS